MSCIEERVVAVAWNVKVKVDRLLPIIKVHLKRHNVPFNGNITVRDIHICYNYKKITLLLSGQGAHDAVIELIKVEKNQIVSNFTEHNKEWYCICGNRSSDKPNIGNYCRDCGSLKPNCIKSSKLQWKQSKNKDNTNRKGRDQYTNNKLVVPWYDASSKLGLYDNDLQFTTKKDDAKALVNQLGGRIWAIDISTISGAKMFIWSRDVSTFEKVYDTIPSISRHAYEVIPPISTRMFFDLDAYNFDRGIPINIGKDGDEMTRRIIDTTQSIISEHWNLRGQPRFRVHVATAHGQSKVSYHLIFLIYDMDGNEVYLKDIDQCKQLAHLVDNVLGESIQVMSKNKRKSSFIDLSIYTFDRLLRLVNSSKATSPTRPLTLQQDSTSNVPLSQTLVVPQKISERNKLLSIPTRHSMTTHATHPTQSHSHSRLTKVTRSIINKHVPKHWIRGLEQWVLSIASTLPNAERRCKQGAINYVSYDKYESIIHFTINRKFASYCYNIGREHKNQNIIVSVNVRSGLTQQTCWDKNCRGGGHSLCVCSSCFLPADIEIDKYESNGRR